jgi:membrane-associated phospholipid phosphatase
MNAMQAEMRMRRAAIGLCVLAGVLQAVFLALTDTGLNARSLLPIGAIAGPLALVGVVYVVFRPDAAVSSVAGGFATLLVGAALVGLMAITVLRFKAPLVDSALARADALLGLDATVLVPWIAAHVATGLLVIPYNNTVQTVFVSVLVLGCLKRELMVWELCFTFIGAGLVTVLISAVFPAVGSAAHFDLHDMPGLPRGAGRYFVATIYRFRDGAADSVSLSDLNGVVSFPSFHTSMALMTAYAFRGIRLLLLPVAIWCGLIIVAAMPMGGHYAVDLVGGAAVWALFAWLAGRIQPCAADPVSVTI